ncbi:MAG: hypothetical protein AB7O31_12155 [Burkholderiales bacterium]
MDTELLARLQALEKRLDELSRSVEELRAVTASKPKARKKKEKLPPPTAEEIAASREQFASLFQRWMDGREIEVQAELDQFDPDRLRRFADANNLNVTAKMSKERILALVAARFREKRQLHRSPAERG